MLSLGHRKSPPRAVVGGSRREKLHPSLTDQRRTFEDQDLATIKRQREVEEERKKKRHREEVVSTTSTGGSPSSSSSPAPPPPSAQVVAAAPVQAAAVSPPTPVPPSQSAIVQRRPPSRPEPKYLLWEVHGPKQEADLVGPDGARVAAREWMARRQAEGCGKHPVKKEMLVLVGPPGTGKTMLARAILKTGGYRKIVEVWPDGYGKTDGIGEMARTLRKQTPLTATGLRSAVILEELDEVLERSDDKTLSIHCNVPVIATWTQGPPKREHRNYGRVVRMPRVRKGQGAVALVQRVAKDAGCSRPITYREAETMVTAADGDLRQLIISAAFFGGTNVGVEMTRLRTPGDYESPFERVRALARGEQAAAWCPCAFSIFCVQENYLSLADDDRLESCAQFAETLAVEDVLTSLDMDADIGNARTGLAAKRTMADVVQRQSYFDLRPPMISKLLRRSWTARQRREALSDFKGVIIISGKR